MATKAMLGLGNLLICRATARNQLSKIVYKSWFHSTNVRLYRKKKIKVKKISRLGELIQSGAPQEDIDKFVNARVERRQATADYKAKIADVAAVFAEELKIEEEKKKDIAGEQMKKEAEEKVQEAKHLAIILNNNKELQQERELRNLLTEEKRQKEEDQRRAEEMEEENELLEKRRQIVLRTIEESTSFVTRENLEEKIAYALENMVNYNFAITADGKKLYSSKPPGNFDLHGWKGPSPAAFQLGGIRSGEWDFVFEKQYKTTEEKAPQETQQEEKEEHSG